MATTKPRRRQARLARRLAAVTILGALSLVAATGPPQESAQTGLSPACDFLNGPMFDSRIYQQPAHHRALLCWRDDRRQRRPARHGWDADDIRTTVRRRCGGLGGFPGTLHHTVRTDGFHSVNWQVNLLATWNVSCPGVYTTTSVHDHWHLGA